MNSPLVEVVAAELERQRIAHALIGAGALAVHGVARSTFDLDLLTTNLAVLDPALWVPLTSGGIVQVDIRRGDVDDPLAGVVRLQAPHERDVDVVVGRWAWQTDAIERAVRVTVGGLQLPVVRPADLILLKLYAGGSQDKWDIEQVLAAGDHQAIAQEVEARLESLPPSASDLWRTIVGSR